MEPKDVIFALTRSLSTELRGSSVVVGEAGTAKALPFQFDSVFGPSSTQSEVYATTVRPLVYDVMDGYNW